MAETGAAAKKTSPLTNAVQAGLSIYSSFMQIKNLKEYTNTQIANMASAVDSFQNSADTLYLQYQQRKEQLAYQLEQASLANIKAKGTAQASAASSGVAGNSINNLFRGYDRAIAVDNYIAARNLKNQGIQYSNEIAGLKTQAINAINNLSQFNYTSNKYNSNMFDFSYLSGLSNTKSDPLNGLRIDTVSGTGGYA